MYDLAGITDDGIFRFGTVRHTRGISKIYDSFPQIIKKMLFFIFCTLILVEKFTYAHSIQIFINSNYSYHISTTDVYKRQPQDRIALDNWNELVASVREHSDINPTEDVYKRQAVGLQIFLHHSELFPISFRYFLLSAGRCV